MYKHNTDTNQKCWLVNTTRTKEKGSRQIKRVCLGDILGPILLFPAKC